MIFLEKAIVCMYLKNDLVIKISGKYPMLILFKQKINLHVILLTQFFKQQ